MNVLVVENDDFQRMYISKIIQENFLDVRVYEASSVKEAKIIINSENEIEKRLRISSAVFAL